MATEKLDPRAELAKMDAEEKAVKDAQEKLTADNEAKRKVIKEQLREVDLADVREKCKLHGFSQSDLRAVLKTRGAKKGTATPRKSAGRKPAAKKRAPKS
jgi:hypothetical protein